MHYNADAYLDALEKPTFRYRGCTFVGRHVSFEQWVVLQRHVHQLAQMLVGNVDAASDPTSLAREHILFRLSMRKIVDAVFPKRCATTGEPPPRRGWLITRPARVSELLEDLPLGARIEAIQGFIRSQEMLQRTSPTPGSSTTTETREPPPTGSGKEEPPGPSTS